MLAADHPPTLDALMTLCTSVLEWNERLDELNGRIALRQVELARLEEYRPTAPSLRNKGSTESLRPRDGPAEIQEDQLGEDKPKGLELLSSSPPNGPKRYEHPGQRPSSATPAKTPAQTGAVFTPTSQPFSSTPQKSPPVNARPSSNPSSPRRARPEPAELQPESFTYGDFGSLKHGKGSMIMVHYDGEVPLAFENLVKVMIGSRSAMRKAVQMAKMRRAAEMEIEAEGDSEGDEEGHPQLRNALLRKRKGLTAQNGDLSAGTDLGIKLPSRFPIPEGILYRRIPRFTARSGGLQTDRQRSMVNANVNQDWDIFEKIDKSLEWCQSHCEFAAHKFLREAECSAEIENIKNKLSEVRSCAEKEIERLKAEESIDLPKNQAQRHLAEEGKSRDQKPILVRKGTKDKMMQAEVDKMGIDKMEVDDEGFEYMNLSQIVFQRSGEVKC